jgi:hypothetical protein
MRGASNTTAANAGRGQPATWPEFYGLSKPPFAAYPGGGGTYMLFGSHRRAFELLVRHLTNGGGLLLLRGEAGAGKTAILHAAGEAAAGAGIPVARIGRSGPAPGSGRLEGRMALLADDADLLPPDGIGLLSRILRPGDADAPPPPVAGTCTADAATGELARLARAIVPLPRLTPAEQREYIEQSLWIVGGTTRRLISPGALKQVVASAAGLPGAIDRLMEAAFLAGFARGDPVITSRTIEAAAGPRRRPRRRPFNPWAVRIAAGAVFASGAGTFLYKGLNGPPPVAAALEAPLALRHQGDQALAAGDIAAARPLFERAAEGGDARAATEAGKTYDPNVLTGTSSVMADPARAAAWYRKGAALGDGQAAGLLQRLTGRG